MSAEILERMRRGATLAKSSDPEQLIGLTKFEMAQKSADDYNRTPGRLHEQDGYNCEKCMNRGHFEYVVEGFGGIPSLYHRECECMKARGSLRRLKKSGLGDVIEECTFDRYNATEPWQQHLKAKAQQFIKDEAARWFFVGGASGGGKTHLCTAICRHYLRTSNVYYMLWEEEYKKLNAAVNDEIEYARQMDKLKKVDVLYIDDFLKPIYQNGELLPPTPGEMKRAYELLNHRYIEKLVTIISSERYSAEIVDLDQAVGGRIVQRARGYVLNVERDPRRNYRTKEGIMI